MWRAPAPSSHRTCGFPASGGPGHPIPQACTGKPRDLPLIGTPGLCWPCGGTMRPRPEDGGAADFSAADGGTDAAARTYGLRRVGLRSQFLVKDFHQLLRTALRAFDLVDRHPVDSGCAPIGTHLFPRCLNYVSPIDPIIQRVESKLRLLLGLLVQLPSQSREFPR
jgi:hypothetical protein